ncbi:MAG TPA: acyl-CoA dehydrogenase family protein, partial [Myxococcaceae bacterium]|nr:acyl-CoA dehydrogenase family protein [Myxococcaceae bacterium]
MADKATTSFMRSLCMGVIEEDVLLPFPAMAQKEGETLRAIFDSLKQFLGNRDRDFRAWDLAGEMPPAMLDELRQFGLFGLVLPEDAGGLGLGSTAYSRTLQELSRYDGSVAATVGAHSSIGLRGLLLFGTPEQRARFYPKLATGEMIAAFCLTEPGAGSDAAAVRTTAVRQGDHWILNGDKLWITNGGIADFFTVFAKTPEVQKNGKAQMTAFIVTRDMPGVSAGP